MALGRKPVEIVNEGKHQLLVKAEHWERIYLNEVAKVQNGYAFNSSSFVKSGGLPLIRIRDIDRMSTVDRFNGEYSDDFIVKRGDILIGMDGDFKAAIWKGENALLNQRVCKIIPNSKNYNPKFLFICLQPYLNAINEETSSVTVKHLSSKTIEEIPLPFPPLPEQNRIVAKIEELFSSLDKGIESLKTAQQQLKVYRQAVLKWAFEGKLTNSTLPQAQGTVTPVGEVMPMFEHVETTISKEGSLPKGWVWMRLGEISEMCLGKMLDKAKNKGDLQPYLRNISVRWGTFDLSDLEKMKFEELEKERYSLKKGDLVICEGGEPGRCAIWISNESMYIQKALHRIRMHNGYDTKYVFYFIFFSAINGHLEKYFTGTTIKHLTGKELKKVTIPTPLALSEQHAIVAEIESRLSVCDKIEESIEQSLKQAESLRQSILKKAFEGKLVPQDPNDEPASRLLERIRAQQELEKKTKTMKRKNNED